MLNENCNILLKTHFLVALSPPHRPPLLMPPSFVAFHRQHRWPFHHAGPNCHLTVSQPPRARTLLSKNHCQQKRPGLPLHIQCHSLCHLKSAVNRGLDGALYVRNGSELFSWSDWTLTTTQWRRTVTTPPLRGNRHRVWVTPRREPKGWRTDVKTKGSWGWRTDHGRLQKSEDVDFTVSSFPERPKSGWAKERSKPRPCIWLTCLKITLSVEGWICQGACLAAHNKQAMAASANQGSFVTCTVGVEVIRAEQVGCVECPTETWTSPLSPWAHKMACQWACLFL